jgi:hypothetical protein
VEPQSCCGLVAEGGVRQSLIGCGAGRTPPLQPGLGGRGGGLRRKEETNSSCGAGRAPGTWFAYLRLWLFFLLLDRISLSDSGWPPTRYSLASAPPGLGLQQHPTTPGLRPTRKAGILFFQVPFNPSHSSTGGRPQGLAHARQASAPKKRYCPHLRPSEVGRH